MEPSHEPQYVVATYEEIRLRFGLGGTDQARIKAKRRKWEIEPRNHPGAIARIRVPRREWDAAVADIERERSRGADPLDPDQSRRFNILNGAVEAFREERDRLLSERDEIVRRFEARLEGERLRAATEATELRAEMAKLRTDGETARLEAARAQAVAEGLRTALEAERRPFWRRWIG